MRDMLSNELKVGDAVHVKFGSEWIGGVIVKLNDGGLALGIANPTSKNAPQQISADVVVLQVTIPLGGHPGQPQPLIVRLDTKSRTEEIVKSTLAM